MRFKNNISYIVDIRFRQDIETQNKNLISVMAICFLSYSSNKRTNLFQMMNRQFLSANHLSKRVIESLYQMDLIVSNKTISKVFRINIWAAPFIIKEWVKTQQFFIFYDNINFYEYVCDQHLYKKCHLVNYTFEYICFINFSDGSLFLYISRESV